MKYLLKFKIKTWGDYVGDDKSYDFIIKVEFIDEDSVLEGLSTRTVSKIVESRCVSGIRGMVLPTVS